MPQIKENFDVADKKVLVIHADGVDIVTLLERAVLRSNSNTAQGDIQALKKPMLWQKSLSTVQAFPSIRIVGASGKSLNTTVPWDAASMKAFVLQNVGVIKTAV
jgi:hypothetical protein